MSEQVRNFRGATCCASWAPALGVRVTRAQDAQHVHESGGAAKAAAQRARTSRSRLTAHEYATLQRLSDLIIPADEHSQGALEAGAADFIDFLCSATDGLAEIYTGGLAWLDAR